MARAALIVASLAILTFPTPAAAQLPFLQWGAKRIYKEFGRGVRVRTFLLQEPTRNLSDYQVIEVERFDNEILELMPGQMDEELAAALTQELSRKNRFQVVNLVSGSAIEAAPYELQDAPAGVAPQRRTLRLSGSVRDYYPGNEALRALNTGLRSLYTIVQVRLEDKESGAEIFREQIVVEVYQVRGKAHRNAVRAVGKKLAQQVEDYQEEGRRRENRNEDISSERAQR